MARGARGALLDRARDPAPLYHQFSLHLRRRIERGEWGPGEQLPSEPELAREYGLSRGTVREGLDLLAREGLVERRQGHGTFVRDPRISSEWTAYYGFVPALRALGHEVQPRPISVGVREPDGETSRYLQLAAGEKVVEITRLILVDGLPFLINVNNVVASLCPGLEEVDFAQAWLHETLEDRYGIRVTNQDRWFEPVMPTLPEQRLLKLPSGLPCLSIDEVNWAGSRPVQFSKILVRGDRSRPYVRLSWAANPEPDAERRA